jgi:hypothetical protein
MHTWGKSDGPVSIRLSFVLRIIVLIIPVAGILLALRAPDAVISANPPVPRARSAESFQTKLGELQNAQAHGEAEIRLTSDEVTAGISQSSTATVASDPVVSFEGDVVNGRFVADVAGEHLYVTVAGHLGAKDGYVTFEPTKFTVGHLTIPVSLVNSALQSKIHEAGDQLKLPNYISDLRVEDGELVIKVK